MKKTKLAFLHSVLALLLCVSMLVGTTFAWFTDGVTSGKNRIVAGNLDVELYYMNDETSTWQPVGRNTNVFKQGTLWEPGHTEVVKLKVVNAGSLALKYQLGIYVASEVQGTNMAGETFKLSDYIKYGVVEGDQNYDRKAAVAAVNGSAKKLNEAYAKPGTLNSGEAVFTVVVYMPESVDNVANYRGDAIPKIELGIQLAATQLANELDSFGPDYDAGATYPPVKIDFSTTLPVPAEKVDDTGALVEAMTVGNQDGIRAEVPAGALLVPGADDLGLVLESKEDSEANLNLKDGQSANPLDITMPNLDPNNTQLIKVTIPGLMRKGLNSTSVEMYHVENGVTVAMKLEASLADLDAHNEFYYDPATGDVTICTKSFSEYVPVTDDENLWEGTAVISWYNDIDTEFTLYTAEELAGLGVLVDNGNTFAGKTVKLGKDIDLKGTTSFNPIGCGYVNGVGNSGSVTGCAFMGTFDGQNYTISNLYQNGWELGLEYCNLGGGLFASIANGTVKNLTISGANIVMECVEQGILVGLSQGTCTYENINIKNSKVANYQKATGGLIGETSAMNGGGKTIIKDVVIGSDVVVGSLWGDFDAPVGGVIGARWDDADVTEIEMTNVAVAARLDVYNDVTSAYQWYAYRRAGMLIGNTETDTTDENGRTVATAKFLKCENVVVKYGSWVNYNYYEFTNQDDPWQNNYPWVRAEAGENCSAFSNPRYGHPVVGGTQITTLELAESNKTNYTSIPFGQLYGGGQGVYGQPDHDGVTVQNYYYKVEYINDGVTHVTVEVTDANLNDDGSFTTANSEAAQEVQAQMGEGYIVNYWMNAGSTRKDTIEAGNLEDVKLYPSFKDMYTASYVDLNGNILAYAFYEAGDRTTVTNMAATAAGKVPTIEDCDFVYMEDLSNWEVHYVVNGVANVRTLSSYNFDNAVDVTIYPVYTFKGDVNLIPVDNNGDGITDEYKVGGYSDPAGFDLVEIPATFNGKEVTSIEANAFSSYDGIHSIVIPDTITSIGANAFASSQQWYGSGETVTIYYKGTPDEWINKVTKLNNWDDGIGASTCIFFLDENNKVDSNAGYYEYCGKTKGTIVSWRDTTPEWAFHKHAFPKKDEVNNGLCSFASNCLDDNGKARFHHPPTDYTAKCTCDTCKQKSEDGLGLYREDKIYWTAP